MYLKSVKGAPFRQSPLVKTIIGSTPRGYCLLKNGWSLLNLIQASAQQLY